MRVRLLFRERNADLTAAPPEGTDELIADLDLAPVLEAMEPDRDLDDLCPAVLFRPLVDAGEIAWRQQVLADALADPALMLTLFDLAGRALQSQRALWMYGGRSADSLLTKARSGLEALLPLLRELARFAAERLTGVRSAALTELGERLVADLDAAYLDRVAELLRQLRFPDGMTTRVRVRPSGLLGTPELLPPRAVSWWAHRFARPGRVRFELPERDEAGAQALDNLRNDGLYDLASTVNRIHDQLVAFFTQLRGETGFYVGCLQLHDRLTRAGVAVCWPEAAASGDELDAEGLVNLSSVVRGGPRPVPNDLVPQPSVAPHLPLAILTGANQGGKTTFLRSIGCAQLLLQAGLFVPAVPYRSSPAPGLHSHFRGAEQDDPGAGKLAEELGRMSRIVDRCRPGDLLLMNESFSSTDELQGTFIAAEIVDALLAHRVRVVLVTHFQRLAVRYLHRPGVRFLRAERLPDGVRTHRLLPGAPEPTSHALDIFRQVMVAVEPGEPGQAAERGRWVAGGAHTVDEGGSR